MSRKTMSALAGAVLACAALVPAVAFGGAQAAATHTVTLHEFGFHPGNLSIRRGDQVKWVWRDNVEHNVTFHGFHSHTQVHGSYTVRFNRRGTFKYFCTIHVEEGMRGK